MKQIINLTRNMNPDIITIENAVRDAKQSNDYIRINIPRNNYFIQVSFNKDYSYTVGYNIWDLQLFTETTQLYRQYRQSVIAGIAKYLERNIRKFNS